MRQWLRLLAAIVAVNLTIGAARWVYAQAQTPAPVIITGADIGFQVDREQTRNRGTLTGTWVVRYNGQWIEPFAAMRGRPLGTR
jgi:hypothetical protein